MDQDTVRDPWQGGGEPLVHEPNNGFSPADPTGRVSERVGRVSADVLYLEEEVDWVKFNVDMSGYYMVHYQEQGWGGLIRLLQTNHTALSSSDRANLINNVFQLVR